VRDANLLAALRQAREFAGATPGALETFLAVRGPRTLALRLERAQRNAMTLAVCAVLQLIQHATSLGALESTIERRASVPGQEHVPPALLRLSVGIEAVDDLWTDLDRALRNWTSPRTLSPTR
jgi:cystathionine gamma-synthase